jgi:hypothetical protein
MRLLSFSRETTGYVILKCKLNNNIVYYHVIAVYCHDTLNFLPLDLFYCFVCSPTTYDGRSVMYHGR